MAILFGLARIGRDAEIRTTSGGESVCSLSLAFNYYDKSADKGRGTQWVDGSLWGKRAEQLAPYLKKGGQVSVTIDDIHVEEYQGKNGTAHKLAGRVIAIDLAAKQDGAAPAPAPAPRPPATPKPQASASVDDIPF